MVATCGCRSTCVYGGVMSRVAALGQRYATAVNLAKDGLEIVAVGDPAGARFDVATRRLIALAKNEGGTFLDDLMSAAKALRWRRITHPQPAAMNLSVQQVVSELTAHARRLRGAINDQVLLDELMSSANELGETDSPVGTELLATIEETGIDTCVVVAASRPAAVELGHWLRDTGALVVPSSALRREQLSRGQAYVVGPPRFYGSSLLTAPVTEQISFLLPAWFRDRSVPQTVIAPHAEGAIRVAARVFTVGEISEPVAFSSDDEVDENEYLPQPAWGNPRATAREASNEEVSARKLLLSGNLAIWLDDGERIRSLEPDQPDGERVTYTDIRAVRPGTYLLLREGETERKALHDAAMSRLDDCAAVRRAQAEWKHRLTERIHELGYKEVVRRLGDLGVKSRDQARPWTDPDLIRPASDQDFERLLQWLGLSLQPTFGYATSLRKALHQVSAELGKQLEAAVGDADLSQLDDVGHLRLDLKVEGFRRGILATRVLAVSPSPEVVHRSKARKPFEDRSGQWLE